MFKVSEIFQHAIQMEIDGERMYRKFAEKLYNKSSAEVFRKLAVEEVAHRAYFEKIVNKIEDYSDIQRFPDEYFIYIRALASNIIFSEDKFEKNIEELNDVKSAVDFAIRREMDSILYYYQLKKSVNDKEKQFIDDIIAEEERHFILLSDLKKEL